LTLLSRDRKNEELCRALFPCRSAASTTKAFNMKIRAKVLVLSSMLLLFVSCSVRPFVNIDNQCADEAIVYFYNDRDATEIVDQVTVPAGTALEYRPMMSDSRGIHRMDVVIADEIYGSETFTIRRDTDTDHYFQVTIDPNRSVTILKTDTAPRIMERVMDAVGSLW
jgi:hypothetical protein